MGQSELGRRRPKAPTHSATQSIASYVPSKEARKVSPVVGPQGPRGPQGFRGETNGPAERELLARWAHQSLKLPEEESES